MLDNLPFQIFAWIASVLYALEAVLVKIISNHQIKNPWLLNAVWTCCVCLMNIVVCIQLGAGMPSSWGNIILAGFFFAVATSFFIFANYRLDISVLSPLFNFRTIFVLILGTLFLGEVLSGRQLFFIAITMFAGVFVTLDEKLSLKSFYSSGVILALADMAALAMMAFFLNRALAGSEFWTVNLWYYLFGTMFLVLTLPFFRKDIKTLSKAHLGSIVLASVLGVVGNFAASKAYASNIGISGAIISIPLSVVMVMLITPLYPKLLENHTAKIYAIRIVATVILVWAGIMLS